MSSGQINSPIVFRGPNGAASGVGAQHSQCFASWYAAIPGLKVKHPVTHSCYSCVWDRCRAFAKGYVGVAVFLAF